MADARRDMIFIQYNKTPPAIFLYLERGTDQHTLNGAAFCPAHVTGFFSVERTDMPPDHRLGGRRLLNKEGRHRRGRVVPGATHVQDGMASYVLERFREATGDQTPVRILHRMEVPAGYGLGTSGGPGALHFVRSGQRLWGPACRDRRWA